MNNMFHEKLTMILYKPSPAVRAKSESNWKSELEITWPEYIMRKSR